MFREGIRLADEVEGGEAMNVPEKLEVPVVVKDTDGNEHEVERLVYRLERNGKSRWNELFGTPERAARTLAGFCADCYGWCPECGVPEWMTSDPNALLGWLRGESDGE
jgi:hypothetical protein